MLSSLRKQRKLMGVSVPLIPPFMDILLQVLGNRETNPFSDSLRSATSLDQNIITILKMSSQNIFKLTLQCAENVSPIAPI